MFRRGRGFYKTKHCCPSVDSLRKIDESKMNFCYAKKLSIFIATALFQKVFLNEPLYKNQLMTDWLTHFDEQSSSVSNMLIVFAWQPPQII